MHHRGISGLAPYNPDYKNWDTNKQNTKFANFFRDSELSNRSDKELGKQWDALKHLFGDSTSYGRGILKRLSPSEARVGRGLPLCHT